MKILEYITDDTLIITPNNIKLKILEKLSESSNFLNVKFMNLEELKRKIYFDYDVNAILTIMDKYNLEVDIAKTIMNNLYYIEDKNYIDSKLSYLKSIKEYLDKNKLLKKDPLFTDFIHNRKVICFGYASIDKLSKSILDKNNAEVIIDNNTYNNNLSLNVLSTLEEEVEYVFFKISELLEKGVDINKIKIANVTEKYFYTLDKVSKIFNIPIDIKESSIYSTKIVKEFLKVLRNSTFSDTLDYIKDNFDLTNERVNSIYNILIDISNKYNDLDYKFENIYKLVSNELKSVSIHTEKLDNKVELVDIKNNIFDDEYVFLLNFNQKEIPIIHKDEDYLSDKVKIENNLLLETSIDANINEKQSVINSIKKIKNLYITAKERSIDSEFLLSNLVNELNMKVEYKTIESNKSYSYLFSKLLLAKELDNLIKYGQKSNDLSLLYNSFNIDYLKYSNKFTELDKDFFLKTIKNLSLSYTSIDNYYHCAFKYYLTNILKLDKYEENFNTKIGTLFHYILSKAFTTDFDFGAEYDNYVKNMELDKMELFFINKLKKELEVVVSRVRELHKETGLTKLLLEHKISIDISKNIPVKFNGIVDKIMYKEKENTLVSIIDYKTGHNEIDLYNVLYGLSMQLPIYLYLVKKSNLFKNVRFTGFYLQQILSSEVTYSPVKTYVEQKQDNMKLCGYSNSDLSILEVFIPDYEDSQFVKSMKMTSKGFYHYAKVLDDNKINNLVDYIDKKIIDARDKILDADFEINPKQISSQKIGCDFCKFRDICYRTNNDFVKLKENKSLDFLGGENNA